MPETIAVVAAVASIGSAVKGFVDSGKASKAGKQANRLQQQQNDVKQARERRQALREARIRAATAQQNSTNQGVANSSAAQGGVGSIQSQGFDNANYLDQTGSLTDSINSYTQQASNFNNSSNLFFSLSDTASKAPEAIGKIRTIFD